MVAGRCVEIVAQLLAWMARVRQLMETYVVQRLLRSSATVEWAKGRLRRETAAVVESSSAASNNLELAAVGSLPAHEREMDEVVPKKLAYRSALAHYAVAAKA